MQPTTPTGSRTTSPLLGVFERERRGEFRGGREPGDAAAHLGRHRLVFRHPDFVADDHRDLVAPRFERVGDATEELGALGRGQLGPLLRMRVFAAATARSMSAGSPAGMVAKSSSVVESITSSVPLPEAATHAPSI